MLQRRSICVLWAFAVGLSFLSRAHAQEPSYLRGAELTSQFEIEPSALRKSIRAGEFTFDLAVTNRSNRDQDGPLALVIENTGVKSLSLKKFDHHFADDQQGFLDLVKLNQTLKAGETLKLRRLRLKSAEELEGDPADQFSLVARIYKLKSAKQNVAGRVEGSDQNAIGQGFPGGVPLRLPEPVAGQNGDEEERGRRPVPDPIGDTGEEQQVTDAGDEPPAEEVDRRGQNKPPRVPTDEELESALKAKRAWEQKLFKIEGVHSIGRAWGKEGNAVVRVKVEHFNQKSTIPSQLDGVPVEVYVAPAAKSFDRRGQIGYWRELGACEDSDPKEFFTRPIKMGVSGWNVDIAICATGTLGCRLENASNLNEKFILSNSHVLADGGLDLSGTGRIVMVGDSVTQPGPLDFSCAIPPMAEVGQLAAWTTFTLTGTFDVDAAVATTDSMLMGMSTPCNGYGVASETTVAAVIGEEVMKYGRTTSFTTGTIIADNVAGPINYGPPFAPVPIQFNNMIEIVPDPAFAVFSDRGDSGSLIVTRNGRNPVALLFAGSIFSTLGNPIDTVLTDMGADLGITVRVDGQP